ncbi:MAG: c-type cytochrome [Terriglobus sp.]
MPTTILRRAAYALCAAAAFLPVVHAQHIETSTFNQAPARPKEDPRAVSHGKQVYDAKCASCHAADLRGALPDGVNVLRSQYGLTDHGGDKLIPIMMGTFPEVTSHAILTNKQDASDVAAYMRSIYAQIGSQGRTPGDALRQPNILVGDATKGEAYFQKNCASCHSATGDLKGISTKVPSPKLLQSDWLRGQRFGVPTPPVTASVTQPGKPAVDGSLIHIDDFLVTLKLQDGSVQTIARNGAVPKVVVKDPLEAHRAMLPKIKDSDIHDVTAYLVTLK